MDEYHIEALAGGIAMYASQPVRIVRIWLMPDDVIALNAWCGAKGVNRPSRSRFCGVPISLCYGPYSRAVWSDGSSVRIC